MKKLFWYVASFVFWFLFVIGFIGTSNAQYITVITAPSGCVVDGSGTSITSGTMVIVGTDGNDNPIVYRAGSSAMATTAPVTRAITSGSLGTSLQLADPSQTSPLNVSYRMVIQDNTTKKTTVYKNVAITPNDTLVSGSFTQFNFCKMNPFPLLTTLGGFSTPSLVSGDWIVTRDVLAGRNVAATGTVTGTNIPASIPGTGACTNQFVRSLNALTSPTCSTVGSSDLATSLALVTPNIGAAAGTSLNLNSAATGSGASLTTGGTSSTTGGISVFVGAPGSATERLSVVPADGGSAATRVGSLSVRTPAAGFLTGTEVASISSTGAVTGKSVNGVQKVDQFAGATADVKIAACLTAISSGGTCDASGFGATTQSIAATITVPVNSTLLFDPTTKFQSSTSSLGLFTFQPGAIIKGFNFDCTNQPSYTGIMFKNDVTKAYGNWDLTELSDISTNLSCAAVTGFTSLKLTSSSNTLGVSFLKLRGWRIIGGTDGVFMTTTSTGFVNGNHLSDMIFSNTAHGWHITGVTGGAIQGNVCSPCSFEKDSTNGVNGVLIDGSAGQVDGNQWYGSIWDTTVPVSITNSSTTVLKNLFAGYMNGTPSDVNGVNNFIYSSNSTLQPNLIFEGARINTVGNGLDIFDPTAAATTPHKFFRIGQGAGNGILEILNSAFGADIFTLTDTGLLKGFGGFDANAAGIANAGPISGATTGAFSGVITSTKPTGTAPFAITSTTPVPNLTLTNHLQAYLANGTQGQPWHILMNQGALTAGSATITISGAAVFTSSGSYFCWANDITTATNGAKAVPTSGTSVTVTGTGTDTINTFCLGG